MNLPDDPRAAAAGLVAVIGKAVAPLRARTDKLEIEVAVLRGEIATLRGELAALSEQRRFRSVA